MGKQDVSRLGSTKLLFTAPPRDSHSICNRKVSRRDFRNRYIAFRPESHHMRRTTTFLRWTADQHCPNSPLLGPLIEAIPDLAPGNAMVVGKARLVCIRLYCSSYTDATLPDYRKVRRASYEPGSSDQKTKPSGSISEYREATTESWLLVIVYTLRGIIAAVTLGLTSLDYPPLASTTKRSDLSVEQQRPRRRPVGTRNPDPTSPGLAMQPQVALDLDNLLSAIQAHVRPFLLDAPSPNVIATGKNLTRTHATFYISYRQRVQVADPLRPSCFSGEAGAVSLAPSQVPRTSATKASLSVVPGFLDHAATTSGLPGDSFSAHVQLYVRWIRYWLRSKTAILGSQRCAAPCSSLNLARNAALSSDAPNANEIDSTMALQDSGACMVAWTMVRKKRS
ncbi:uncharacterized protein CLUP02_13831 [Colletotrichum lupini]|uniref:Uncharacterized protein n=1 Tax=Colletotrichum lupini TaxID=145971 RepID=A0A9Q8T3M7_9PEZI|nr:uncharacterized protein CLUP02_13831 [Colletotrichum lupini]UQC88308.1 hypothetical protein CLUP02_13831 [Colletotrichum lupini]